jgi:hypothetical protein
MRGSLFAENAAIPFVPFTENELESALKRGDVLVYVPRTSLNGVVDRFKSHFNGNTFCYRDAGFMRIEHEAGWWLVGVGPFVRGDVATTPRRASALVFVYACILSEKYAQRALFTGVASTDCHYNTGAPVTFRRDNSQVVAVWSHDKKINVSPVFESSLPENTLTAYSVRGTRTA